MAGEEKKEKPAEKKEEKKQEGKEPGKEKVRTISRMKGKEWFEIVAPKFLGDIVIGETAALTPEKIVGRTVETNLMEITNDPGRYYINLTFKINRLDGGKAYTEFFGHECTRDFLARIVQQWTNKVDTNDIIQFKDGKIRVKCIIITNRHVQKSVETKIRKRVSELLKPLSESSIESFVKNLILGKMQSMIKKELNKIYPVRVFEFRKSEVLRS